MILENGKTLTSNPSENGSEEKAVFGKKSYEAPALTIVKFMFENDITWGSFEYSQEGDDDGGNTGPNPGDSWWN